MKMKWFGKIKVKIKYKTIDFHKDSAGMIAFRNPSPENQRKAA
jgi:hypothetical protein